MKISIIVPVYNAEKYLDRCVASILAQTYSSLEVILVNDGSTDHSGEICGKWQQTDPRIAVIHQENQGVSAARNAGLDYATGEFIGFVDADDEISPETYETAIREIKGHDIAMWDAVTVWSDGRKEPDTIALLATDRVITRQGWTPELLGQMAGSAGRCMYRQNCIKELRFAQGIKFSEDRLFNLYAMGRAQSLRYLKVPLYYRLMHAQSAVHRYHEDYFEACKSAHRAIMQALAQVWDAKAEYIQVYNRQFIGGAVGAIHNYFYKTSPLTLVQKREKIRALCDDRLLQNVLSQTESVGLRGRLMKHRKVTALCVLAWLANKKHRR